MENVIIQATPLFTYNIRQATVPGLTEEQYRKLIAGEQVQVETKTAEYMLANGYAFKPDKEKPSSPKKSATKGE